MRLLITGIDGYIGSVLGPWLARRGHDVTGLDTGFFRSGLLYESGDDRPATLTRDTRTVMPSDLEGFEAIVHLAELSNDPLGAHSPANTFAINHRGSMALAATGSGVPSTLVALARGDDVLASTRAAGTLLVGEEAARTSQLLAGVAAHLAISTLWTG